MKIKVASFILAVVMVVNSLSMALIADDIVIGHNSGAIEIVHTDSGAVEESSGDKNNVAKDSDAKEEKTYISLEELSYYLSTVELYLRAEHYAMQPDATEE